MAFVGIMFQLIWFLAKRWQSNDNFSELVVSKDVLRPPLTGYFTGLWVRPWHTGLRGLSDQSYMITDTTVKNINYDYFKNTLLSSMYRELGVLGMRKTLRETQYRVKTFLLQLLCGSLPRNFRNVAQCSLVWIHWCSEGIYCHHLQRQIISQSKKPRSRASDKSASAPACVPSCSN
jgi:hypothetical protein